ncbi:mitochondrial ribosomal protein S9 precursor, putative [Plasmodium relictum]|uniref:Mitochondrial ribosomal protein S9, putative n=1 Tax=Plasmodium relictum TaxID=85471 RepID=A0A1J1H664_PLARL|nr:mitochondrial ribosomal protein S9 precursor, putative [Plasmodium relictum]CRH00243.1 mitochondrial ribosomal protein S9 precursor, putative [Plasmodium relictum]
MKWVSRFTSKLKRYNNNVKRNIFIINMYQYSSKNEINNKKKNDYILSLDEALYLSKEMGIKTTTEIQKIIMRSPPFSSDASPFVIENFLSNIKKDDDLNEIIKIDRKIKDLEEEKEEKKKEDALNTPHINENEKKGNNIINKFLISNFNKKRNKTFFHDNKEWLEESEGIGTNKRSCAYVYIKRGSGVVKINNQEDLYIRWPYFYNRIDVLEPFYLTNTECIYDVFIKLKGGGISGQSKAARLAIGRALLNACPLIYNDLVQHDILYEDMRQKFPKMPGRKKSRSMKQWSKR